MRRLLVYTGARLGLFAVAFLLLWLILHGQLSIWVLALFALLLSSIASLLLLRGHAEDAGREVATGWRTARKRLEEAKRREDDDLAEESDPK